MMLLADPYALLHTEPVRRFAFIIVPEGSRVNLGLLYVRGAEADALGGAASVLWDVVRRLRLFVEDWTLRNPRSGKPNMQGLWDQGIFTDALASAVLGRHVYPYTYVQSPNIGAWRQIGWPPPNRWRRLETAAPSASRVACQPALTIRWSCRDRSSTQGGRRGERAWPARWRRFGVGLRSRGGAGRRLRRRRARE